MRKQRFLIAILIIISMLISSPVYAQGFPDLLPWAKDEVLYLNKEDVVSGYPDGRFGSRDKISRGDAALMLVRAKKLDLSQTGSQSSFPDVTQEMYYHDAIEAATQAGYLGGFPDQTFKPKDPLTREQMAKIITYAFELKGQSEYTFSDIKTSWAREDIEKLAYNGISNGTPEGTFQPKANITRAEFSVMLARAMNDDFKLDVLDDMAIYFLDVGQGDSTFIQTSGGKNILIDAGIQSAGQKVVSFLKSKDVGKLDLVIATHPHADHIGGLIPVLKHFEVDQFVDSGAIHTSQTYLNLLNIIDEKNIPFEVAKQGNVYHFDHNFSLKTLHADSQASLLNNASVVVKGNYGDVSVLLTGDAEKAVEDKLVNGPFNLSSTIYKAGHHGSNTSSTDAFVNKVKPEITILSYGKDNAYGHPHPDVVNRLQALGSKLYSTADSGDITVNTNGSTYHVSAKPLAKPEPKPEPKPDPKPSPDETYPININTADYETLQNITGVGEVIAQRIIDYRNKNGRFNKPEDLIRVKGIGPTTFKKMRPQIKV